MMKLFGKIREVEEFEQVCTVVTIKEKVSKRTGMEWEEELDLIQFDNGIAVLTASEGHYGPGTTFYDNRGLSSRARGTFCFKRITTTYRFFGILFWKETETKLVPYRRNRELPSTMGTRFVGIAGLFTGGLAPCVYRDETRIYMKERARA